MKKSVSRVFSLMLAVAIVMSFCGVSTALAAPAVPTLTVYVDSGNVSVFPNAQGGLSVTVNGANQKVVPAGGLIIAQRYYPATPYVRSISLNGVYSGVTLSGLSYTSPAGVAALSVNNSAATITSSGQNALTGNNAAAVSIGAGSTATFSSYANALKTFGGMTATSVSNNGTLNVAAGTLAINYGGIASTVNVNGGALTVAGNASTLNVNAGTATINGNVTTATVKGGTANLNGAVVNANVNGGIATVTGALTNATLTGGTLDYKSNTKLSSLSVKGGTLKVNDNSVLPNTFSTSTSGTISLVSKVSGKPTESSYSVTRSRGTSFDRLGLKTTGTVTLTTPLGGQRTVGTTIKWDQSTYNSSSSSTQTVKGTVTVNAPYTGAVNLTPDHVTARVARSSSSGGGSTTISDPGYDYWMDVQERIEDADDNTARTIYASDKYDDMPTSVLEALKGTKITLVIERSAGDIKIYGKNMKAIPSSQVFYKLADLAKLYKNVSTSDSSSEPSVTVKPTPGDASSTAPAKPPASSKPTYTPPAGGGTTVSSSSSSSSSEDEESSSESEEESSSSEEEESSSEDESSSEEVMGNEEEPTSEKKSISPIAIVAIVAAVVALAAGIISYVVIRKREF